MALAILRARIPAVAMVAAAVILGCGDDEGSGGAAPGSGSIQVQVTGEDIATDGFRFPQGSEVTISDGWEITFDHVIVTVGKVWLSETPDIAPSDQSKTGPTVAEAAGPWAIDLAAGGTVPGAGGEGTATPLVVFDKQNVNDGAALEADQRYAFSYEVVAASSSAEKLGFAGGAEAAYADAVSRGCSMLYVGTATFKGTTCEVSDPAYDFAAIPTTVPFSLCFKTPTAFLNCQNQDNQGDPFPDEEFQRGVAVKSNEVATAQLTFHLDHPFYGDVEHEPRLFFDQFAAALVGAPPGTVLALDLLAGVDPTGFVDGAAAPLPWRVCDGSPLPSGAQRAFDSGTIPIGPGLDPTAGFRDYVDYVSYVQSSQGHLNGGEGICFTDRKYPAPR
jgi:hypothetical protein